MIRKALLTLTLGTVIFAAQGQQDLDSLKILRLEREIESLRNYNENLSGTLEITNLAINDLVRDKKVSDETKWLSLKASILHSTTVYKKLSDDIINLKSRVTDEDYQGFIKTLGSIQGGPLGFSFQDVIIETAKKTAFFESKTKMDRFLEITNNIIASPITAGVPFVSQAVFASNSLLNVAYSSMLGEKKPDYDRLKKFENELNKYLTYYTALDKANIANQSSTNDRIVMLENLQLELLGKLKKEAPKLGFDIPDRKNSETLDAYFNRVLGGFSKENVEKHIVSLENKYRNNRGEIQYATLLQQEQNLKHYNAHIFSLVDMSKKFILYYDNFFEIADNYHVKVLEAIALAHRNGIIQGNKVNGQMEDPLFVYEKINFNLKAKKTSRDNGIKDSINIADLKQKIEKVEEFRLM
ncbi:hypothetical protein KIH41_11140 [Litoribacter ruber]|uniref:Uncharacterized protein n=1 Tax=Litoribacter ruber TaxID=702568 RepID=A0AAP2CJR1_9BACT|nr:MULTISPECIES: hypothetical protein [Litoribacter]MBS9525009.1 hypothetical protein [Litoribacter alkaliphilus]MBT0811832.1 hypothetical protein [Litoribacter ruber]